MAKRNFKKRTPISRPNGYPYVLFSASNKYVLSATSDNILDPVKILDLIKIKGHKQTTALLKQFGDKWVCKEGKIFFPRKPQ